MMSPPVHYPGIALLVVLTMQNFISTFTAQLIPTVKEVCLMETFHARCSDDSVISLQSALYGRMRPSDCDPVDRANYGCVANVLEHMDGQCSGKTECSIDIPDGTLIALNPCARGHFPYMEISYVCIPAISSYTYQELCQGDGVITLSETSDTIISSSIIYDSHQDRDPCPLTVRTESGKQINVTIVDFSHGRRSDSETGLLTSCQRYAMITEEPLGIPRTVCRGMEREKAVYKSESDQLELQLSSTDGHDAPPNFLLRFSAVGCTDPNLNGNDLTDRSPQTAELHCHSTGKTQRLVCAGQEWDARAQSCDAMIGGVTESWTLQGLGIILGIGIVTGAIIACSLMACVWFCIKRRTSRQPPLQIVYYEGTSPWNAAPPIDQWDGNNALIVDYNTRTRRKKDYEPVYHPLQHDVTMTGNDELLSHSDRMNRNIFDELPPVPPPVPMENQPANGQAYKPK